MVLRLLHFDWNSTTTYFGDTLQAEDLRNSQSPQKQYHHPGSITETSGTMEDLSDAEMVIPTTFSFNCPKWPVQRTDGS